MNRGYHLCTVATACLLAAVAFYIFSNVIIATFFNLHLIVGAGVLTASVLLQIWQLSRIKFSSSANMWITTGISMFFAPSDGVLWLFWQLFARQRNSHVAMPLASPGWFGLRAYCAGSTFFLWPTLYKYLAIFNTVVAFAVLYEPFDVSVAFSQIVCDFGEEETAGKTVKFSIQHCRLLGISIGIGCAFDSFLSRLSIEVRQAENHVSFEQSGIDSRTQSIGFTFVPYKAGNYKISALYDGQHLSGSPVRLRIVAGLVDHRQSGFISPNFTRVCRADRRVRLPMRFVDLYGNPCAAMPRAKCLDEFHVRLCDEATGDDRSASAGDFCLEEAPEGTVDSGSVALCISCATPGLYRVRLKSRHAADNGTADAAEASYGLASDGVRILVLPQADWRRVKELTSGKTTSSRVFFKAYLNTADGSSSGSSSSDLSTSKAKPAKQVYCYLSNKQLAIKKLYLNFIPKLLFTFRNNTALRVESIGSRELRISDGASVAKLELDEALVLAGCIFKWLADACGGVCSFEDRRQRLYEALDTLHSLSSHGFWDMESVTIDRRKILDSSLSATESLSVTRWARVFEICFVGEFGVDRNGLRREWISLLMSALFDPEQSGLFTPVGNGRAIMPNYRCQLPVKYYRFAGHIVAKCIMESARGGRYVLPIRLHFAQSFLAQLLGFHVDHRAFTYDDPELYEKKIKYILECDDVADLELTFTDDELDERSGRSRTVEIVSKGASLSVTRENRTAYVDALARHRFCERVKDRVRAFVDGFRSLIPEDALTAFDERDLDMLLTGGVQQYSAADMRPHVDVVCRTDAEKLALERFWLVVSSFADEQMTRLVQFVTGSSLLPPGGFASLTPKMSINFSCDVDLLPVAHTCYNSLCLPVYQSAERMRECLQIAINEGSHGFGLV